jgi:hypothetical protein
MLAFLGCVSISAGSVFAEPHGHRLIVIIENFNQSTDAVEPTDEQDDGGAESEGTSCGDCYPPPE